MSIEEGKRLILDRQRELDPNVQGEFVNPSSDEFARDMYPLVLRFGPNSRRIQFLGQDLLEFKQGGRRGYVEIQLKDGLSEVKNGVKICACGCGRPLDDQGQTSPYFSPWHKAHPVKKK